MVVKVDEGPKKYGHPKLYSTTRSSKPHLANTFHFTFYLISKGTKKLKSIHEVDIHNYILFLTKGKNLSLLPSGAHGKLFLVNLEVLWKGWSIKVTTIVHWHTICVRGLSPGKKWFYPRLFQFIPPHTSRNSSVSWTHKTNSKLQPGFSSTNQLYNSS